MTAMTTPHPRAIYLPPEAASYFRAASPSVAWAPSSRQVYGWIRRGLLAPAFRDAPEASIVVDFDDLVTGQAISLLRAAGISLRAIERAESFFVDLYGIDRPYAHQRFWTSGRDIFGEVDGLLVAGTRGGQLAMPFMEERPRPIETHLAFDRLSGRPISWSPGTSSSGQPCSPVSHASQVPQSSRWRSVATLAGPMRRGWSRADLDSTSQKSRRRWHGRTLAPTGRAASRERGEIASVADRDVTVSRWAP
jgi:hypothetical protein